MYEKVKRKSKKHVRPRVDQPCRPGTRAWIKAQGEGERQKTSTPQILQLEASPSLSNRKPPAIELRPQPRQSDRSHQHFGSETPPQVLKSARTGKDTRNRFNSKASAEAPNQTPENPFNRPQTRSAVNHNSLVRTDSGNQQVGGQIILHTARPRLMITDLWAGSLAKPSRIRLARTHCTSSCSIYGTGPGYPA